MSARHVWLRTLMGVFYVVAGVNHFLSPAWYEGIMPPALPAPLALIFISGIAEILGGIGVLIPRFRRAAGWGLIALLVAVFPANVYAAMHGIVGSSFGKWILMARLPFQGVLIFWAYQTCIRASERKC